MESIENNNDNLDKVVIKFQVTTKEEKNRLNQCQKKVRLY